MLTLNKISRLFSTALSVPIVDVEPFLNGAPNQMENCKTVAEALHTYGCLIIKDPRVKVEQNNQFIDLMEKFFDKRSK